MTHHHPLPETILQYLSGVQGFTTRWVAVLVNLFLAECAMGMEPHITRCMQGLQLRGQLPETSYTDIIHTGFSRYRRSKLLKIRRFQGQYLLSLVLLLAVQLLIVGAALLLDALLFSWLAQASNHAGFWLLVSCVASCIILLGAILFAVLLSNPMASQLRRFRGLKQTLSRFKQFRPSDGEMRELGDLCYHWLVEVGDSSFAFKEELRRKFSRIA